MKYKGYKIGKLSRYIISGFSNQHGFVWNVNKDGVNRRFDTLREAKEYINSVLS